MVGENDMFPLALVTTTEEANSDKPVIVTTLPEEVALKPFWVIFAATFVAAVVVLLEATEAPDINSTPSILMLLTEVLVQPEHSSVRVAVVFAAALPKTILVNTFSPVDDLLALWHSL
ncbi:MAG: hypothetical protein BWY57_02791 [Betaproteobacteria bacterium ADurb.Bin341]|nr:MAG: hypothetical protein BWY57_02791 [Betaproteobacteria bacterium ADurb.Bin341]